MTAALDDLAGQADRLRLPGAEPGEAAPPPESAGPEVEPSQDERNTQALCMVAALLREVTASDMVFQPPLRTLADRLPDDKLPALLAPWGRVLTHYRVDLGAIDWATHPLAVAAIATGPALWSIAQELRHELRARAAKPVEAEPAEPAGPAPA